MNSRFWQKAVWAVLALTMGLTVTMASAQNEEVGDEQRRRLKTLAMETRGKVDKQRDVLKHARMELLQVYLNYDLDSRKARSAMSRISGAQKELLDIHLRRHMQIRDVLSQDQFRKFTDMMRRKTHGPGLEIMPPREEAVIDQGLDKRTMESLNLRPDQQRRFADLLNQEQRKTRLIQSLRQDAEQIAKACSDYKLNDAAVRKLIADIHRDQVELMEFNHQRQQTLRSILDSEQFERFKQQLTKHMRTHGFPRQPRYRGP